MRRRFEVSFIDWLKKNFAWMFLTAQANTSIGTAFIYGGDNEIPAYALLAEYDNGSAVGNGRSEYIYLPTDDGGAMLIGALKGNQLHPIHTDHLGTPRSMTNDTLAVRWQLPYSAFGTTPPSGVLRATLDPKLAITNKPMVARTNPPVVMNIGLSGQYQDAETGLAYNYFRSYSPASGRYTQMDPIGLAGGFNRLGYVGGNPLSYVDPEGLQAAAGARLGAAGGFALGGPPGAIAGGLLGFGGGLLPGYGLDRIFNENAAEPVVYPDSPENAPDKFRPIKGSGGKQCDDGSVWERDTSSHGGDQWKRWSDRKSWEKGKTPNSVWPNGRIRK